LIAGGPDSVIKFALTIAPGLIVALEANMAHLVADVVAEGDDWSLANGLMAGAIRKHEIKEALALLSDLGEPVVDKPLGPNPDDLIDILLPNDIDTDGDGENDAVSFAFKFTAIRGIIVGLADE